MAKPALSSSMQGCLSYAKEHGGLVRQAGGYWVKPTETALACKGHGSVQYFGTPTVEALVTRGLLRQVPPPHGWRQDRVEVV